MLYGKCEKRVMKHLKTHGRITEEETAALVEGQSVKLFYSKTRFGVTDPGSFAKSLLKRMEKLNLIGLLPDGTAYGLIPSVSK